MPLEQNGLIKLSEECGELIQASMKRVAFDGEGDIHWDGSNMRERLADEIADVLAACTVVQKLHDLDSARIEARTLHKVELFKYWHDGGTSTTLPENERLDSFCKNCETPVNAQDYWGYCSQSCLTARNAPRVTKFCDCELRNRQWDGHKCRTCGRRHP